MGHELTIRTMKTVSRGTREIVIKRSRRNDLAELFEQYPALSLVHGDVCELIYASDLAQKASEVEVFEIGGSCPHI